MTLQYSGLARRKMDILKHAPTADLAISLIEKAKDQFEWADDRRQIYDIAYHAAKECQTTLDSNPNIRTQAYESAVTVITELLAERNTQIRTAVQYSLPQRSQFRWS